MWRPRLRTLVNRKSEADQRVYTQNDIAQATDLRQPTISVWMNYDTRLSHADAVVAGKLAKWIGCDPRDLFEWVEDDTDPERLGMLKEYA